MIKETLEKILNTLEKCCEETHQNHKSEYQIRRWLFDILSKNNPNNIKEYDISILNEDKQNDFRQQDELFPRNEKWYLVCNKEDSKTDTLLLCDKIKDIPCNVIFNNCNIDLHIDESKGVKKDNTETIKNHLYFYNCAFEKSLNLKNIIFEKTLTFNQCVFYNNLEIYQNQFLDHLVFINCHDNQDKKITSLDLQENEFKGYFFIKNCAIEKINLWKNKFKNRCYFIDSMFLKVDKLSKFNFSNANFQDNVYFNNTHFKDYVDFHECEFEKIACFYGVKFYKTPNFSACYFKEPKAVNLINVDIDKLDFKSVEKYIEDNYQDESYKNEHKLRYAKNLKDSFRVIKDVLITQNNTLEAQEWHKLELYAKEKELEIQLGGDNKDSIKNIQKIKKSVIKKPSNNPSNILAKIQSLSDKYIKICDFVVCFIMLIGRSIFGFLLSIIEIFCNVIKSICKIIQIILSCIFCIASIDRILKLEYLKFYRKISSLGKTMLDFTLWFDCVLLQVYRNTSNHHTNFLKILNFTILMISSYAIFGLLFLNNMDFILSFDPMTIATTNYIVLLMLLIIFIDLTRQLYQYGAILLFLICGLFIISIVSFLSPTYIPAFYFLIYFASVLISYLLFICKIKLFIFISRLFAYTCLIGVVILKPQLINPFVGIFSSDKLYESKFEKRLNDLNTSAIINLAKLSQ
ncbi:pentapeptide repeat-containing protein, partial [Campylobacter jejuni]|nr:pentapeptide repeat-containing protein [Campylobacter jejuni]EAL9499212.1 pentapeptide repeat-containing protein [Campylobacter jejuni]EHZ7948374.1 pentapeptide repeat-containing protein [Campylobacter jejuni]